MFSVPQLIDESDTQFMTNCPPAVTESIPRRRTRIQVFWTAPPSGSGCVTLKWVIVLLLFFTIILFLDSNKWMRIHGFGLIDKKVFVTELIDCWINRQKNEKRGYSLELYTEFSVKNTIQSDCLSHLVSVLSVTFWESIEKGKQIFSIIFKAEQTEINLGASIEDVIMIDWCQAVIVY